MSELTERLRKKCFWILKVAPDCKSAQRLPCLHCEAADEIERLEKAVVAIAEEQARCFLRTHELECQVSSLEYELAHADEPWGE